MNGCIFFLALLISYWSPSYVVLSHSVVSNFVTPWTVSCQALLVCGDSPGKNTGVGCRALLQGILPTQGSNPGFPHYRQILYNHQGSGHLLNHQRSGHLPGSQIKQTYCYDLCTCSFFYLEHSSLDCYILISSVYFGFLLNVIWRRKWQPTPVFLHHREDFYDQSI